MSAVEDVFAGLLLFVKLRLSSPVSTSSKVAKRREKNTSAGSSEVGLSAGMFWFDASLSVSGCLCIYVSVKSEVLFVDVKI